MLKKTNIKNKTECIGFLDNITNNDEVIIIIQGKTDKTPIDTLDKNFVVLMDDGTENFRSRPDCSKNYFSRKINLIYFYLLECFLP